MPRKEYLATTLRYPSVSLPDIFIGGTSQADYRAMFGPLAVELARRSRQQKGRLALRCFLLRLRQVSSSTVVCMPARARRGVRRQSSAGHYVSAIPIF